MATSTEEILIRLGLDSSAVQTGMSKTLSSVQSFGRQLAAAVSGGAVLAGLNKVIDKFDDLKDKADNLGAGTDFLQGMSAIASKDAVGGTKTFDKAISELSVRLGSAKDGSESAIKAFQKFGISLADIQSLNTEQMFYLISERIKAIPDPAQRASAAFELLGKAGKSMVGVMSNGSESLKKMVDAVDKLDSKTISQLAAAKDQIEQTSNQLTVWIGKGMRLIAMSAEGYGYASTGIRTMMRAAHEEKLQQIESERKAKESALTAEIEAIKAASAIEAAEFSKLAEKSWDIGDKIHALLRKIQGVNAEFPTIQEIADNPKSKLRNVAKVYLRAQKYQKEQRELGNFKEAERARGWMNTEQSILKFYGANPSDPAAEISSMTRQIDDLNAQLKSGVIKTEIVNVKEN